MPLLGQAAMLLSFDVVAEAVAEHDDWHTHEHLPERLSIPGFMRGTRWVALGGGPRYVVLYEVAHLGVLTSDAYLQRLDNPSPWTSKIMAHYRGMSRGFCSVTASFGFGLGHVGMLVRFKPDAAAATRLRGWLDRALSRLPSKPGIGSAHLLEGAVTPQMTNEQRIRGADAGVDWAILVTGYSPGALAEVGGSDLAVARLTEHGATGVHDAMYRMDYLLTHDEVAA